MLGWQISRKDLRLLLRDRRALTLLIALPLVFISIIGFSSGRMMTWRGDEQQGGGRQFDIDVVDQDQSPLAQEVVDSLKGRGGLNVVDVASRGEAEARLNRGESVVTLVIGPEFYERFDQLRLGDILNPNAGRLSAGPESLDMQVIYKATFGHTGPMVRELLFSQALQTLVPHVARKNRIAARYVDRAGEDPDAAADDQEAELDAELGAAATSAERAPAPPDDPLPGPTAQESIVYQEIVPSYTVLFVFFLINLMARSFIAERDLGTLRRLRTAPVGTLSILVGKTFPFLVISLLQSVALFIFGKLLFGMSWGVEPWLLLPVIFVTSLTATALGLLVATLVRTESQVSAYANFLVIVLGGVSGCFLPRDWMPEIMQQASLVTPHAWALIAYQELLNRSVIDHMVVVQCCAMLAAFATAFFIAGWWRFKRMN